MKKVFLYSSVLALTLTACSNDEILSPVADSGKAVGFGTLLTPATRGSVFTTDNLKEGGNGFSVAAYNQGTALTWADYLTAQSNVLPAAPDFMNNTKVAWSSTKWDYIPIKYWPGIVSGSDYGHVTFFALGGLSSSLLTIAYNSSDANKPEYTHTVSAAAADQKDLVADVLFDQYWENDKKVKFQFNHVLSKIGFEAKLAAEYSGATVMVTLQVNYATDKVKNSGTYAFNTDAAATGDAALGSWTYPTTPTYLSGNSGELTPSGGVTLNNSSGTVATPKQLNDADKFLMLIPQTVAAGDLTVNLTYTITTGSPEETVTYPVTYQIPAITYSLGKQYTYSFTLTLNPVVFDTTLDVKVWEDGTSPGAINL
jgi:hypothetical protein